MACILERYPQSVSIMPDGMGAVGKAEFDRDAPAGGWRYFDRSDEKQTYIRMRVLIDLSGTIAHDLKFPGRAHDQGDENDANWARDLVVENVSWEEDRESYLTRSREEASALLKAHWPWVEAVALALLQREALSGEDILQLRPLGSGST